MDEDDAVDGTAGRRDGEHSEEGKKNRSREKEREGETGDGCDDDGQWLCIPVKLFSTSPASVTGKPQPFSFDPLFHSSIARVRARARSNFLSLLFASCSPICCHTRTRLISPPDRT